MAGSDLPGGSDGLDPTASRTEATVEVEASRQPSGAGSGAGPGPGGSLSGDMTGPRASEHFVESTNEDTIPSEVLGRRICDFLLTIDESPLAPVIRRFQEELLGRGIDKLKPVFYLTDEWGVPDGTVAIGIPFYLADPALRRVHEARVGLVEGTDDEDLLRYLRHEMGHVVNYAYRLYQTEDWTALFGPMARPYVEDYVSIPFSPDYVRHLPGNYAQKHPDEDWAETFAVWMTPGLDWRGLYEDSPGALAKLEYCDRVLAESVKREPEVVVTTLLTDVTEIDQTVQEFYEHFQLGTVRVPRSLDGDLRGIFIPNDPNLRQGVAHMLLRRQRDSLAATVYRWTGVDPSFTQELLHHLIARARALDLAYHLNERDTVLVQVSSFLTTLAMNYAYRGKPIPS